MLYPRTILTIVLSACSSIMLLAQIPDGFNYQAVARNADGTLLANESVNVTVSVLNGPGGSVFYRENHSTTTNVYGQIALVIGEGTPNLGEFSNVYWPDFDAHLQVTLRFNDQQYELPATPLQSAPYAIWSAKPWELGNDEVLYYLNGPVGIGTDSPQAALDVSFEGDPSLRATATGFGAGSPAVELVRGGSGSGTDWRMRNNGGILSFDHTTSNFTEAATGLLHLRTSGNIGIGTDSPLSRLHIADNGTGETGLTLESPTSNGDAFIDLIHNAGSSFKWQMRSDFDNFRLSYLYGDDYQFGGSRLFVEGLGGGVGIGNFSEDDLPAKRVHVRGSLEQSLRLESINSVTGIDFFGPGIDFRMGNFLPGFSLTKSDDNFTTSPALVFRSDLDDIFHIYEQVSMENHRITNLADPGGSQHAVNRRYLEAYVADQLAAPPTPHAMSLISQQPMSFAGCATYCRELVQDNQEDWTIPSFKQAVHFVGAYEQEIWTSTINDAGTYAVLRGSTGANSQITLMESRNCGCVR